MFTRRAFAAVLATVLVGAVSIGAAAAASAADIAVDESPVVSSVTLARAAYGGLVWPTVSAAAGAELTYQWYVNGTAPAFASTDLDFYPSLSMIGSTLSVSVTGTLDGYQTNTVSTPPVVISPGNQPVLTVSLTGTGQVGRSIGAKPGSSWVAGTTFSYAWLDNGAPIPAATGAVFTPTAEMLGHQLSVQITGSATGYADKTLTAWTTVHAGVLTTATPTISGPAQISRTLTAVPGAWTAGTVFSYQWLNCHQNFVYSASGCTSVSGATGKTLLLSPAVEYDSFAVKVTGSLAGYTSASVVSSLSGDVEPVPHVFTRIAGSDRWATAVAASKKLFPNGAGTVFLASGVNFPDALSAAPAATSTGADLLVTAGDSLPPAIASELKRLHPGHVYVIGGTAAISPAVTAKVRSVTGVAPRRLAGADRYATSAAIAATFFPAASTAFTATGARYQNALTAAAAAGSAKAPLLLVNGTNSAPSAAVAGQLKRLHPTRIEIVGATGEVSARMQAALAKVAPVTRLAGTDFYSTAVAVSQATHVYSGSAVVASVQSFPDALVGAVVAGVKKGPLYLAERACLPLAADQDMNRIGAGDIIIMGGTSVLSPGVAGRLDCDYAQYQ